MYKIGLLVRKENNTTAIVYIYSKTSKGLADRLEIAKKKYTILATGVEKV